MVDEAVVRERVLSVPNEVWDLAVRRARVIGPLAERDVVGRASVEAAAAELRVSARHVYVLLRRWRQGEGVVSDLIRAGPAAVGVATSSRRKSRR